MGAIHRLVQANGVRHHLVIEGEGPLVILVHGFPESWYSWRYQLSALAEAGYQAAAIDVRGYGRSYKLRDVRGYRMVKHVGDVVDLVGALGAQSAVLVGHDWGALELGAAAAGPVRRCGRAVGAVLRAAYAFRPQSR